MNDNKKREPSVSSVSPRNFQTLCSHILNIMASLEESLLPPKERLVSCLARLYKHCLTTTTGGNISLVDEDGVLYITPSGGDKAIVPPSDIAVYNPNMDLFEGPRWP
eukprot:831944_1